MPITNQANKSISDSVYLPPETKALIQQAWEIRRANFPPEVAVVTPVNTRCVSVTGSSCALDCAHCGKHYLRGMISLEEALLGQGKIKPTSYLISGGCTSEGKVPLLPYLDQLFRLKKTARLNLHTGLVSREEARALAPLAETISFDFVCSKEIIENVYGLDKDASDYINSYRALVECLGIDRVVPHITIGLLKGRISSEINAVKILAAEGISKLVLLVFIPTPGTRYQRIPAPDLADTIAAIARIRALIPTVPIYLGCMRPGGAYRRQLDPLALHCGINKIVQPAPDIHATASKLGLDVRFEKECCAL